MKQKELKEFVKVLPINKNSTNLIFIDKSAISLADAARLAKLIKQTTKSNFGAICMVIGNPNKAVKLISAEDLKNTPISDASGDDPWGEE